MYIFDKVKDNILKTRSKDKLREAFWTSFLDKHLPKNIPKLKIALLNAPCYGFGDIIFAQKIAKYLREWYNAHVVIFTTLPQAHISLGESPSNLIKPVGIKQKNCRRFTNLKFPKTYVKYDLYFVTPLVSNFEVKYEDVTKIFKHASKINTFVFSEYNLGRVSDYDFPTGVGPGRDGILLVKPPPTKRNPKLKKPYAMLYIASEEHIPRANNCAMSFIEMVAKKYSSKHKKFDIVVPNWVIEELNEKEAEKKLNSYYDKLVLIDKNKSKEVLFDYGNEYVLTLRGDILPVNNKEMFSLMKYSVKDILLTGDQSITDAISCCSDKNIFYQIASWKTNFAKYLAKYMPNKYLIKKSTSCGTLKAINYKSNYTKFKKDWDFRKRSKDKMNAIILSAITIKKNKHIKHIYDLIKSKSKLSTIKKDLKNY